MDKNIKYYLHLYLGCKIFVRDIGGVAYEDSIDGMVVDESVNLKQYGDFYFDEPDGAMIQLLLRPLSDMTLDEMAILQIDGLDDLRGNLGDLLMKTSDFLMLLHWGFDIFDLIPSGLAIDATKQLAK